MTARPDITDIQVVEPEQAVRPKSSRTGRLGVLLLVLGVIALAVWAALAPLDEGVPTQALVTVDTKRKAVQHIVGGIVRQVLVGEGQQVQEGQPLIRLDDAVTRANFEATRQRYLAMRAMEDRLLAEQRSLDLIEFSAELRRQAQDPLIARHLATQEQLFATRRAALRADLQALEEAVRGQQAALQAYGGMVESRQTQRSLLLEQWTNLKDLVREGYAPRNQQLDLERQLAEVNTAITDLQGNKVRATQSMAELRQRAESRRQDYRKETDAQLAEVAREVQSDRGKVQALQEELDRTLIRSPASGYVVGLSFQTVGGVVPPGQKLMEVVPQQEALILEAKLPPHLIDAVRAGQLADVRFSGFAHSPQLVAEARVLSVSADLITDQAPQGSFSYFLARLQITPDGLKALGRHQVQPGMTAEVIIRTGERTVLEYLLHPLTRRVAASMKEQ
jgi:protease secretion system membrane fusion protein